MNPNTPETGPFYVPRPAQEQFGHPSTWPAPQPATPPTPRRTSRAPLIAGLVILGVLLVGGIGAGLWYVGRSTATPSAAASPSPTWSSVTGANCPNGSLANGTCVSPVAAYKPKPDDFTLTVKILEKKCYGSAGCNVTFRIELAYSGPPLDSSRTYELTYEVAGTDEESYVNTLLVTGTQYRTDDREFVGTKSSKAELKATVTGVSER